MQSWIETCPTNPVSDPPIDWNDLKLPLLPNPLQNSALGISIFIEQGKPLLKNEGSRRQHQGGCSEVGGADASAREGAVMVVGSRRQFQRAYLLRLD